MCVEDLLIALTRSEICGVSVDADIKTPLDQALLAQLYDLAENHDMAHIAGQALGNLGLLDGSETARQFKSAAKLAYTRHMQMEQEYARLCRILEQAQIPYLPLKGAVIRKYYPESWLRTSCDIDILIQKEMLESTVALLVDRHGYTTTDELKPYDVSLFSPRGVHLELHFSLVMEAGPFAYREMLAQVWDHALPVGGHGYQYQLPDDWFYLFHIVHLAKHFRGSGCGIRLILDTWILNHRMDFDRPARDALLEQGKLLTFEQGLRKLSEVWFSQAPGDSLTEQMERYIIGSGTFGTQSNRVVLDRAKTGGKAGYVLSRIFVPYDELQAIFPVLRRHKWLTPLFQVVRWLRIVFVVGIKNCLALLKKHDQVSDAEQDAAVSMLRALDLLDNA